MVLSNEQRVLHLGLQTAEENWLKFLRLQSQPQQWHPFSSKSMPSNSVTSYGPSIQTHECGGQFLFNPPQELSKETEDLCSEFSTSCVKLVLRAMACFSYFSKSFCFR